MYLNSALPFSAIITYILHKSLGCEPFGIILSSLLGRFNEGNIILLKNPQVLRGRNFSCVGLCIVYFLLVQYFDVTFDYWHIDPNIRTMGV